MSSEVETSLANVRQHQGAPVSNRRLYKVDGLVSYRPFQTQIVRDSTTSLGMTKRGRHLLWNRRRYDSTTLLQRGLDHEMGTHSLRARESATAWTTRM